MGKESFKAGRDYEFPNEEIKEFREEILGTALVSDSIWWAGNVLNDLWRERQCLSLNKETGRWGYDSATGLISSLRKCLNNWQNKQFVSTGRQRYE